MDRAVDSPEPIPIRLIGLDVNKQYAVAAGIDDRQPVVLSPRRVALNDLGSWAAKVLRPPDILVLEAMFNTWEIHDHLVPLVACARLPASRALPAQG